MLNTFYPISVSDFYKDIINEKILEQIDSIYSQINLDKKFKIKSKYSKEDIINTKNMLEKELNRLVNIIEISDFQINTNNDGKAFELIENEKESEIVINIFEESSNYNNNEKIDLENCLLDKKRNRNECINNIYNNNSENIFIQQQNNYNINYINVNKINENIEPVNINSKYSINISDLIEYTFGKNQEEKNSIDDKIKKINIGNKYKKIKKYPINDLIMKSLNYKVNKMPTKNNNNTTLLKLKLPKKIKDDYDKLPKLLLIVCGISPEYHNIIRQEIYNCIKNDDQNFHKFLTKFNFNINDNDIENIKFPNQYIHPSLLYSFSKTYRISIYYELFLSGKKRIIHLNHHRKENIYLIMKNNPNEDNKYNYYDLLFNLANGAQIPLNFKKKIIALIKKNI